MKSVSAAAAREAFSDVLDATRLGPVRITRRGGSGAVLISDEAFAEFQRLLKNARSDTVLAGVELAVEQLKLGKERSAIQTLRALARHWKALGIR